MDCLSRLFSSAQRQKRRKEEKAGKRSTAKADFTTVSPIASCDAQYNKGSFML